MFKKIKKNVISISTIFALFAPGIGLAKTNWDMPIVWPDGNFHVANAKTFAAEVKQATGGDVNITVHSGGSLGFKGPEMLKVVRDGLAPLGEMLLNQQVGEAPLLGLEATPYLSSGYDDLAKLHKHWLPEVNKVVKEFNQKFLYIVPWPRQYVYTKVDAKSVADLGGIKIRTYNKTTTGMFNRIGMTSVQLPWGEVVPSLAAGTIDAAAQVATLSLAVGIVFLVEGIVAIIASLGHQEVEGWRWGLANGIITLILGLIILSMKAFGLLSVLGILVGISFIFSGIDLIAFASSFHGPDDNDGPQASAA